MSFDSKKIKPWEFPFGDPSVVDQFSSETTGSFDTPKPGQLWQHKNGNVYKVLMLVNMDSERHDEYPPSVVYRSVKDLTVWSRPLSRWHGSFEQS